jgi:alkaline phosphatase D
MLVLAALTAPPAAWSALSPIASGPWSGAVTATSAVVKARLVFPGASARLLFSTNANFRPPAYSPRVEADTNRNNFVTFALTNLTPARRYFHALEVDGRLVLDRRGAFRTFPAGPASFTFAFGSCARTASSHRVFDTIRTNEPLFFLNVGDFHYLNIKENDLEAFRAAYDSVLASRAQALLYRYVPFVYLWDDHDFGGNRSDALAESRTAARLAYQEAVPHYPLAAGAGDVPIHQAFTVGRVRFLLTDLRSERSPAEQADDAGKTMLGEEQKAWLKQQLLAAKGKFPLTFWVSSVPWIGQAGTNFYPVATNHTGYLHHTNLARALLAASGRARGDDRPRVVDHWGAYATERRELADFLTAHDLRGLCILHGDAHMLAADDGRHADFATDDGPDVPVLCGGPLDQSGSIKGGPYSQGLYLPRRGEGCFGLVTVTDAGERIAVRFSGRNDLNQEKIVLQFEVPAK